MDGHRTMATPLRISTILLSVMNVIIFSDAQYNGKLIGSLGSRAHSVAGTIYAADDNTIRIIGFSYDGTAPDAFIWGGESGSPSTQGFIIPDENGRSVKLGQYTDMDIEVTLPTGRTVSDLAWISIWCRQFTANFGHVDVPPSFDSPAEHSLGQLGYQPRVHNVFASNVIIVNAKQIRFENLDYDGYGPRAYFWVGPGNTPNNNDGYNIPDENGSGAVLGRYNDDTFTLTLPDEVTVFDIGHIGLWCVAANQDFGHLDIPSKNELNIPPGPLTTQPDTMEFPNCQTLVPDELQVSWMVDGSDIVIELSSTYDVGTYAAFGISGSETGTQMIGGDVVVTFIDSDTGEAQVVDYYLEDRAQCTPQDRAGACPDTIINSMADNSVTLVQSSVKNGVTSIIYRRPLTAQDTTIDKTITTESPMYVIWARGSINADGRVAYHNANRSPSTSNIQINFGQASSTCPGLNQGATVPPVTDGWVIPPIVSLESTTFTAEMGLSGGTKGYDAITGRIGWGIAWFINDLLIPEITVKRNSTYTFLIRGGNDSSVSANYHPFYITDSRDGGYDQLADAEKQAVTIYAGPEEGPLCQWMNTQSTGNSARYSSFDDYRKTLRKDCQPGEPGKLVWTVGQDVPDLVYYQCYTHRFLGWKIHVTDSATALSMSIFNILVFSVVYLLK